MEFVCNANFKGDLKKFINLSKLSSKISNSKLYSKPHQLVVKDSKGTILFFSNGKFRIMGCIDELDATILAYTYTIKVDNESFPAIELQSYTMKAQLGFRIDLSKMASSTTSLNTIFEPELFPALRICKYKPMSVNVFSTGSVVVCGSREPNDVYSILKYLHEQCQFYKLL